MTIPIQVTTTTSTEQEAHSLASLLVEKKLAGCVQIDGPITSIYQWKNNIEKEPEWRLQIKSTDTLYKDIETTLKTNHSYDTPEIIATKIEHISKEYLEWLNTETQN